MHKLSQELYGVFFGKFNPIHNDVGQMSDFKLFYDYVWGKIEGTKFEGEIMDIMFSSFPSAPTVYGRFKITDPQRWVDGYNRINHIFHLMDERNSGEINE